MTVTSVTFSPKVASDWDPQKPLTTTKMNQLYDNTTNLHERLGGDYSSNTKNHSHDGVDSTRIQVVSNMVPNGDFEQGLNGWTSTIYGGGTIAASASSADGSGGVQITSTVLVNGGGNITSNEYMPVIGYLYYRLFVSLWASVSGVSAKVECVFYDSAFSLISSTVLASPTNLGTIAGGRLFWNRIQAPANARYMRVRLTGGVPGIGTSVGTVYFDAVHGEPNLVQSYDRGIDSYAQSVNFSSASGFWVEAGSFVVGESGTFNVQFGLATSSGAQPSYGRIYKNGVAFGTSRSTTTVSPSFQTFSEDLAFSAGDTVQLFVCSYNISSTVYASTIGFGSQGSSATDQNILTSIGIGGR